jgi:hypothetical protein
MRMCAHDKNADTGARWRDRGRALELGPPPYEQGDWVASEVSIFFFPSFIILLSEGANFQ